MASDEKSLTLTGSFGLLEKKQIDASGSEPLVTRSLYGEVLALMDVIALAAH